MSEPKDKYEKIFSGGVEGGGFTMYRDANGRCYEDGSSKGIEGEIEDKKWSKEYESWEAYWEHFSKEQLSFVIPTFLHPDLVDFVFQKVEEYYHKTITTKGPSFRFRRWNKVMGRKINTLEPFKKLSEVSTVLIGNGNRRDLQYDENGHMMITGGMISHDKKLILNPASAHFYNIDGTNYKQIKQNDILVIVASGSYERLLDYIVYNLPIKAFAGTGVAIIRPNDSRSLDRWDRQRFLLKSQLEYGARLPRVLTRDLKDLKV